MLTQALWALWESTFHSSYGFHLILNLKQLFRHIFSSNAEIDAWAFFFQFYLFLTSISINSVFNRNAASDYRIISVLFSLLTKMLPTNVYPVTNISNKPLAKKQLNMFFILNELLTKTWPNAIPFTHAGQL